MTVWPIVTWPSPAMATRPFFRTTRTVVDRIFIPCSISALLSPVGMSQFVHLSQVLHVYMGVDLGCRDAGMTQHFLNHPDVGARGYQLGGETMPESVGGEGLF